MKAFLAAALLLLALPAVSAQATGSATLTLTPPGEDFIDAGATVAFADFTVALTVSQGICLGASPSQIVINLDSVASGPGASNITLDLPDSVSFTIPANAVNTFTDSQVVRLVASAPRDLSEELLANVTVTASMPAAGCMGTVAAANPATAAVGFGFDPVVVAIDPNGGNPEMPGLALPLTACALVAVALVLRRR